VSAEWQVILALLGIVATAVVAPVVAAYGGAFIARTRVTITAKHSTFFRPINGAPFDAVQVVITDHSAHDVQINDVWLQFYRLLPWPHWKTFAELGHAYFLHILPAHQHDDSYFEVAAGPGGAPSLGTLARANGWHLGPRMVRAKVDVTTISPRCSPPIIAPNFGP